MVCKVLIIIPAYNEEKSILKTYNSIINYNKKHNTNFDVIVINDGSKDNTLKVLKDNNIPYISLFQNLGIGGAVQTGYKYALKNNYDIAVQFDGDGQHDVNYISKIIKPIIDKKANMVIGSRFIEKDFSDFKSSKMRRIGISMISWLIEMKTNKKIYDTTSGFRAIDKSVIKFFSENYPVEYPEPISSVDLLLKKYTIREVAVKMNKREEGISSISSWKSAYYMINVMLSILLLRKVK